MRKSPISPAFDVQKGTIVRFSEKSMKLFNIIIVTDTVISGHGAKPNSIPVNVMK